MSITIYPINQVTVETLTTRGMILWVLLDHQKRYIDPVIVRIK